MNKVFHRNKTHYGNTTAIITEDASAYVMVTIFNHDKRNAMIHDLVVLKERRGEGIGREMLEEAVLEAGRMGAEMVRISVEPNSWLEEWYKRHGFEHVSQFEHEGSNFNVLERKPE